MRGVVSGTAFSFFSLPLTSISKLSSGSITWHPLKSDPLRAHIRDKISVFFSWHKSGGSLTLEMRYTGEDRRTCALCCAPKRKTSWEEPAVQAWLVRSCWSTSFCFSVWSSQRMLKTGKDSKCSLYKRNLGIYLIEVHKYFTWEIDF